MGLKVDLLLEIASPGRPFEVIKPGSLTVRLVLIDVVTGNLGAPVTLRLPNNSTLRDLKLLVKCRMLFFVHSIVGMC